MEKWTIGKSAAITDLGMCINKYRVLTPGLYACINVAVKFGHRVEYPDLMVMSGHGRHKQCEPDYENNYFIGPPNFILEIHQDFRSKAVKERKKLFSSFEVQNTSLLMIVRQSSNGFGWSMAILNYFIQTEME